MAAAAPLRRLAGAAPPSPPSMVSAAAAAGLCALPAGELRAPAPGGGKRGKKGQKEGVRHASAAGLESFGGQRAGQGPPGMGGAVAVPPRLRVLLGEKPGLGSSGWAGDW